MFPNGKWEIDFSKYGRIWSLRVSFMFDTWKKSIKASKVQAPDLVLPQISISCYVSLWPGNQNIKEVQTVYTVRAPL